MLTPQCEPLTFRLAREIAAIRIWSNARVRKQAKVDTKGILPHTPSPTPAPTMFCSAMKPSTYWLGHASLNRSANVEFFTSPSIATITGFSLPSLASASP